MRFGGHQTFYLREGWLYKGLALLIEQPDLFRTEHVFDHLGVGKNMALSIVYWLEATGLAAKKPREKGDSRNKDLVSTKLGKLIYKQDKYFTREETWWILHINLLTNRDFAETWHWFFNNLGTDRFLREQVMKRFHGYIVDDLDGRKPSSKTVERDLSCLLNSYSVELPNNLKDPEEDIWCPLRDLDLLVAYKNTGHFMLQRRRRNISAPLMMYALEQCLHTNGLNDDSVVNDILFFNLTRLTNNPQRVFILHTDGFYESLNKTSDDLGEEVLSIVGLAGERQIRIARRKPLSYVKDVYATKEAVHV